MRSMLRFLALLLLFSIFARANEDRGCAVPITTVYQPVGSNKYISQAVPTREYPLIKETENGYLILLGSESSTTIGLVPKADRLRNPTANIRGNNIEIRTLVNVGIYEGQVPLEANKRYPVVSQTPSSYRVLFEYSGYSKVVDLPKTNCVFISPSELRKESDDAIAKRKQEADLTLKKQEAETALKKAAEERQAQEAKARKDAEDKARAARDAEAKAQRDAEENARIAQREQEEQKIQQLVKEHQYAQLAIIDAKAAQNFQDARAIITNALEHVSYTEVAQELISQLDDIRQEKDRQARGEKALRVGIVQVPEIIDDILRDQSRGNSGEKYWSTNGVPTRLYAPTAWEIVSTDMHGPDATVKVRVDSSNKSGSPIRQIWAFTLTFEDRWRVVRIADE